MGEKKQKTTGAKKQASAKETAQENDSRHFLVFAFLAVSVFLAYSNSLNSPWALDDTTELGRTSIENNLNLRLGHRKIAYLTFLFNKWINPSSVLNYRVFNIIIHVINSVLVYWISLVTLRLPEMREKFGRYSYPVALITATAFALHPININAVAYIVQRMTSLSALFVLLALLSYLYGRTSSSNRMAASLYCASAALIFLGIFSKENALMALPLILLYDYFFISGFTVKCPKLGIGLVLSAAIIVLVVSVPSLHVFKVFDLFLRMNQQIPAYNWTSVDVYWTPLQHIMTEFRVICRYLMLLVLPLPRFLIFDNWGFALSLNLLNPPSTVISIAIVGLTTVMAVFARKKLPLLSFGILWYMLAISLESFLAVGSDLYFEHRNYLPVAGLFFGLAGQLTISLKDMLVNKMVLMPALLIIAVALGGLTYQRNHVWKDSVTLWTDTLLKNPNNLRAEMSLGNAYLKSVDLVSAGKHYQKAMELALLEKRPEFFHDAAYSLGMVNLFAGKLPEAKKVIDLMESQLAGKPATGILKGFYSSLSGDHETAIRLLNASLKNAVQIEVVTVYTLLGDTYRRAGQVHNALKSYRHAINADPSFSAAYYGMGNAYFLLKDMNNAELYTDKALLLDPVSPLALSQMVDIILIKKGPIEKAMQFAEKSISASPPFYQPYAAMGTVLIVMGREEEAEEYFKKAHERGLRGYLLPYTKARAYFIKGDKDKAEAILREIASMDDTPADLRNIIKRDQGRLSSQ